MFSTSLSVPSTLHFVEVYVAHSLSLHTRGVQPVWCARHTPVFTVCLCSEKGRCNHEKFLSTFSISPESELICNDFDYPLLLLSSNVYFIRPGAAVSVVHECSRSCTFKEVSSSRVVERENVQCHQTVFEHD